MILRDYLAIDRTKLANQRTLLSFIRTSLYLVISGIALMKVKALEGISWLGYAVLIISAVVLTIGVSNYLIFRYKIRSGYQDADEYKQLNQGN
ncbi:DUF202 domain-containing protein [Marinoscillum sp.]|uniref:DUF202 domain-containing protein n=1 Tax=Marinoscillum sp. TaxID=2024838 RepID=UPI003BA9343F